MIKFKVDRKELIKILEKLKLNIDKKSTMPILHTVCIDIFKDKLNLSTVNIEKGNCISLTIPIKDQIGELNINYNQWNSEIYGICPNIIMLLKICKICSERYLQFEITNFNIKIISLGNWFDCNLGGIQADDFPRSY
jgi:hypothetical protein